MADKKVHQGTLAEERSAEDALGTGGAPGNREGAPRYGLFSKRIALLLVTNVLTAISGILILSMVTKSLSTTDYGIWVQMVVTASLMHLVVGLGLPGAMVRFLAAEESATRLRESVYTVLAIVSVVAGVAALAFFVLAPHLAEWLFDGRADIVRILAIVVFVECISSVLLHFLRARQRVKLYSSFLLTQTLLLALFLAIAFLLGHGLVGATLAYLFSRAVVLLTLMFKTVRDLGLGRPRLGSIKGYFDFGLPMVPVNVSDWVLGFSDRYLLALLVGVVYVGYYNPGYSLAALILMLVTPLRFLLPAALSELFDKGRVEQVRSHLRYSLKYFLVLAIPASVGMGLLSRPLLLLLTTEEIAREGYLVTPVVALAMVLFGCQIIINQVLIIKKMTRTIGAVMTTSALLGIGANLVLIPRFDVMGAAFSALVAFAFALIATTHFSMAQLPFHVDLTAIGKTVAGSVLMGVVMVLVIPYCDAWGHLGTFLAIFVGIGVYGASVLLLRTFSEREVLFFRSLVSGRDGKEGLS